MKSLLTVIGRALAGRFGWLAFHLLGRLTRTEIVGEEHLRRLRASGSSFTFMLWHGKLMLPVFWFRGQHITALVSRHRDGEMLARTLLRLGYRTIRGSVTSGGHEALSEMIRLLREPARELAIIPDGPKGPARVLKPGIVVAAQRTGTAILPLTFSSSRYFIVRSWDRFHIPRPFSHSVVLVGTPIEPPPPTTEGGLDTATAFVEAQLNALEAQADAYFSR